jgi:nucleoside phosphorylase
MPTVVILAPMSVELAPVVKRLSLTRTSGPRRPHRGRSGDVEVVAALAGVGPGPATEATRWALETYHPDHLLVSGIAGGIDGALRIGDLVVPDEVVDLGADRTSRSTPLGRHTPAGRIVTTATLLRHDQLAPPAEAGAVAVDMETAAVGLACDDAGVPWTAFRGISDLVAEGLVDDTTLSLVKTDGTTDVRGVARLLVTRPLALARMARLGPDTRKATVAAAEAAAEAVAAFARA